MMYCKLAKAIQARTPKMPPWLIFFFFFFFFYFLVPRG